MTDGPYGDLIDKAYARATAALRRHDWQTHALEIKTADDLWFRRWEAVYRKMTQAERRRLKEEMVKHVSLSAVAVAFKD